MGKYDAPGYNEPIRFEQAPMTVTLMLLGQLQSFKEAVLSHNTCIVLFSNVYSWMSHKEMSFNIFVSCSNFSWFKSEFWMLTKELN